MLRTSQLNPVSNPAGFNIERPCSPVERCSSPDVLVGAYLINHLQSRCENCGCISTPQWRKGWYSGILGRSVILCNACGLKFNKNQYCPYCMYVYYKDSNEEKKAQNAWVVCEHCQRWVHKSCVRKFEGKDQARSQGYCCPGCRNGNNQMDVTNGLVSFSHENPKAIPTNEPYVNSWLNSNEWSQYSFLG